jgi:hypothetical protein
MRRLLSGWSAACPGLVLAVFCASIPLTAQAPATTPPGPNAPFDFAIKRQWLTDLRAQKTFLPTFRITMTNRSAVHNSPADCEMHWAGTLTDTVFGDPQAVVVEPPNLCKFKPGTTTRVTGSTSSKGAVGHEDRQQRPEQGLHGPGVPARVRRARDGWWTRLLEPSACV